MTLARGDRLGPYEIAGLLGAGGMAEVYQARDTRLGRHKSTGCLSGPSRVLEMYLYPGIRANLADLEEQETLKVL